MGKCTDCGKELKNPLANICKECLVKIYPPNACVCPMSSDRNWDVDCPSHPKKGT